VKGTTEQPLPLTAHRAAAWEVEAMEVVQVVLDQRWASPDQVVVEVKMMASGPWEL